MPAGTEDSYHACCMIGTARAIANAAKASNAPLELTTYAGAQHGFNLAGANYNGPATDDALARTAAALKRYLGN
jgi:dienelactone hydrolase